MAVGGGFGLVEAFIDEFDIVGLEEADLIRLFKIGRGYGLIHNMEGGFEHTRAKAQLAICRKIESEEDLPDVKGWTVFRWK